MHIAHRHLVPLQTMATYWGWRWTQYWSISAVNSSDSSGFLWRYLHSSYLWKKEPR